MTFEHGSNKEIQHCSGSSRRFAKPFDWWKRARERWVLFRILRWCLCDEVDEGKECEESTFRVCLLYFLAHLTETSAEAVHRCFIDAHAGSPLPEGCD
jgi:hypothetical protein